MGRTVAIGIQSFEKICERNVFYIDKTKFIRDWWEQKDDVTLITRPRRFGKTLNMSMLECFFSNKYEGRKDLFEGLFIWEDEAYRSLQGTYPVIALSFAGVKANKYSDAKYQIFEQIAWVYEGFPMLKRDEFIERMRAWSEECLSEGKMADIPEGALSMALKRLSDRLYRYFGRKVLIFLDEYDTPMQEAFVFGYWDEMVNLFRNLFNNTFKTNPSMERAVITGITRISKESVFSDLNNLEVITTTSQRYETAFGFTEDEVFCALEEQGLSGEKEKVRDWYDGFVFGRVRGIYNPWSIISFLKKKQYQTYWANTSSNNLVNELIRKGDRTVKETVHDLLVGGTLHTAFDEQIVFSQLDENENSIWSLLLASGYLKVVRFDLDEETGLINYELTLTNKEVLFMFRKMIKDWFAKAQGAYNGFVKALLQGDVEAMNEYMNHVALTVFSSFDTGNKPSAQSEPERFYHGFILGILVDLENRYRVNSNRESGFGRYDVCLEPLNEADDAIIMEFKVHNPKKEKDLQATVEAALLQIEDKKYAADLAVRGIAKEKIRRYGFAFQGKKVLIGE